jgi:RNA recognition motif-containing protein
VYSLAQEVVEVYKDYSNNTDYPAVIAKTKKNMYDAYVGIGFTEDQALALMINDNIQLMKNIKQVSSRSNKATNKSANASPLS